MAPRRRRRSGRLAARKRRRTGRGRPRGRVRRRRAGGKGKVRVVKGRVPLKVDGYPGYQRLAVGPLLKEVPKTQLRRAAKKVLGRLDRHGGAVRKRRAGGRRRRRAGRRRRVRRRRVRRAATV